jgi:hypothetical protein
MNYVAHGWQFIDNAYILAGTAVPDWQCVADRAVRVPSRRATPWAAGNDVTAAIARGICQHHADDRWFHTTQAFVELSLDFSRRVRCAAPADEGLRTWFVGHILVELLLDASLAERQPELVTAYYAAISRVRPEQVEQTVNRIAPRATDRLGHFVALFCQTQFMYDYTDDGKLLMRLNQVMSRVRLPALPGSFVRLLPEMRADVRRRHSELLGGERAASSSAA